MRHKLMLTLLFSILILTACGEQTLAIRSTLEGDQYIRNNVQSLELKDFNQLTTAEHPLDEQQLVQFKQTLDDYPLTRYSRYGDELYRYNSSGELLYYTKWEEVNGNHKLTALEFPER